PENGHVITRGEVVSRIVPYYEVRTRKDRNDCHNLICSSSAPEFMWQPVLRRNSIVFPQPIVYLLINYVFLFFLFLFSPYIDVFDKRISTGLERSQGCQRISKG